MLNLLTALSEATECREVDRIIEQNIFKLAPNNRAFICSFANKAKRRIIRLNSEKKQSWANQIN